MVASLLEPECNKNRKDLQILFDPDLMISEKKGRKEFNKKGWDCKMRADCKRHDNCLSLHYYSQKVEYECKVLFSDQQPQQKQVRMKVPSLSRAITLHIPLHYSAHDLPKSWRWNINFPANRPLIMARIQHITFRMFHPRPGYLLNRKEKQLPTTIIWASV